MTLHESRSLRVRAERSRIAKPVLCTVGLVLALSVIPLQAQEPPVAEQNAGTSTTQVKQPEPHTPARGTQERKAIMDALRREYPRPVIFVVNSLKVLDGWAWTSVTPQTADGREKWESHSALLREGLYGQDWAVLDTQDHSGECAIDENCFEAEQRAIQKRWPGAPTSIFDVRSKDEDEASQSHDLYSIKSAPNGADSASRADAIRVLQSAGYLSNGSQDTEKLSRAIEALQRDAGIPVTGQLDKKTMSLIAPSTVKRTPRPTRGMEDVEPKLSLPLIFKGDCLGETCATSGFWFAKGPIQLYVDPQSSEIAHTLQRGEKVTVLDNQVVVTELGRSILTKDLKLGDVTLRKGTQIEVIRDLGEGEQEFLVNGKRMQGDVLMNSDVVKTPEIDWWVQLSSSSGVIGWTNAVQRLWGTCGESCGETGLPPFAPMQSATSLGQAHMATRSRNMSVASKEGVPTDVATVVFAKSPFGDWINYQLPEDDSVDAFNFVNNLILKGILRTASNFGFDRIDKMVLKYLVNSGHAYVKTARFKYYSEDSELEEEDFVFYRDSLLAQPWVTRENMGELKNFGTWRNGPKINVGIRKLENIAYKNKYHASPLGIPMTFYSITFDYSLESVLPRTANPSEIYHGKAKTYKDPDDGLWKLDSLELEDDGYKEFTTVLDS